MARMSIDDKFPRDPRVIKLGRRVGWSRRETMGALIDVFQIVYDRERDTLPAEDIDITAEREGFAAAMIECDLAESARAGVRIKGAAERIHYLKHNAEAGRIGGLKSGESRRNRNEAKRSGASSVASEAPEARGNPPDPVPDPAPDPVPEDQSSPSACAIPGSTDPTPDVPAMSRPAPAREDIVGTRPIEKYARDGVSESQATAAAYDRCVGQTTRNTPENMRGTAPSPEVAKPATAVGDRDVKPAAAIPAAPPRFDPGQPMAIGRLAEATYRRVSDARIALAAELGLPAPIPFPESTPSTQTRGLVELRARIREEGAQAPAACDRVVANLTAQAREERHIDWLSDSVFGDKAWPRARDWVSKKRKAARAAAPARDPNPPPKEIPASERAGPEQFAEARAMLAALSSNGNAPTPTDDTRRKAST